MFSLITSIDNSFEAFYVKSARKGRPPPSRCSERRKDRAQHADRRLRLTGSALRGLVRIRILQEYTSMHLKQLDILYFS